jgi:hypothetical protein
MPNTQLFKRPGTGYQTSYRFRFLKLTNQLLQFQLATTNRNQVYILTNFASHLFYFDMKERIYFYTKKILNKIYFMFFCISVKFFKFFFTFSGMKSHFSIYLRLLAFVALL